MQSIGTYPLTRINCGEAQEANMETYNAEIRDEHAIVRVASGVPSKAMRKDALIDHDLHGRTLWTRGVRLMGSSCSISGVYMS